MLALIALAFGLLASVSQDVALLPLWAGGECQKYLAISARLGLACAGMFAGGHPKVASTHFEYGVRRLVVSPATLQAVPSVAWSSG